MEAMLSVLLCLVSANYLLASDPRAGSESIPAVTALLKSILPGVIESQVQAALSSLFRTTPLENIISSRLTSEMENLKLKYQFLKRQQRQLSWEQKLTRNEIHLSKSRSCLDCVQKTKGLEHVTDQLVSDLNIITEKVTAVSENSSVLWDENNGLKNQLETLKQANEIQVKVIENINKKVKELEVDNSKLRKDNGILREQFKTAKKAQEGSIENINRSVSELKLMMSDSLAVFNDTMDYLIQTDFVSEIEVLDDRTNEIMRSHSDTVDNVMELDRKYSNLEAKYRELREKTRSCEDRISAVSSRCDLQGISIQNISIQIEDIRELSDSLDSVVAKVRVLEGDNSRLRGKDSSLTEQLKTLSKVCKMQERSLRNITTSIEELRMETYHDLYGINNTIQTLLQKYFVPETERLATQTSGLKRSDNDTDDKVMERERNYSTMQAKQSDLPSETATASITEYISHKKSGTDITKPTILTQGDERESVHSINESSWEPYVKTRLLIAPYFSSSTKSYQLTLNGHSLSAFPHLNVNHIDAVAFDPSSSTVLFSRYRPDGIYSINLYTKRLSVLRNDTTSYGLAVDEQRKVLFFTTYKPEYTVSRMHTDGVDFSVITHSTDGSEPSGISLDTQNKLVYFSDYDNLFSVTYEGQNLQILSSGYIYSLAVDVGRSVLYFNEGKKIVKRLLAKGTNEVVTELTVYPRNLLFHNGTVYISAENKGHIYALNGEGGFKKIVTVEKRSVICLLP